MCCFPSQARKPCPQLGMHMTHTHTHTHTHKGSLSALSGRLFGCWCVWGRCGGVQLTVSLSSSTSLSSSVHFVPSDSHLDRDTSCSLINPDVFPTWCQLQQFNFAHQQNPRTALIQHFQMSVFSNSFFPSKYECALDYWSAWSHSRLSVVDIGSSVAYRRAGRHL